MAPTETTAVHLAPIASLDGDGPVDADELGVKAARLATLRRQGHPVPPGFVLTTSFLRAADDAAVAAAAAEVWQRLGGLPVAVRSSAVAEDRADASFAGLYESVLDVGGVPALMEAIGRVRRSASDARVARYDPDAAGGAIAVLVQPMVPAEVAGVAFGADPVTGERGVVIVSAVAGLGETLVSGEAVGEDWEVRDTARLRSGGGGVLSSENAVAVAELVRSLGEQDGPQDVEWAIADGKVHLLQARPMTALPDPATWTTTAKAPFWRRDFRLGEWLPAPVTPLFATWFLPEIDAGFLAVMVREYGGGMHPPFNVVVNGWCYSGIGRPGRLTASAFVRHPLFMVRWGIAFNSSLKGKDAPRAERWMAAPAWRLYEDHLRNEHRSSVTDASGTVDTVTLFEVPGLVDDLALDFGALLYPLVEGAGFAWKAEFALARFYDDNLRAAVGGNAQVLLAGLREPVAPPPHAVVSLDWAEPTLGERGDAPLAPDAERHRALVARRVEAEHRCRDALTGRRRREFDELLELAQRWALRREAFVDDMTSAWPTLRRALLRLGAEATRVGVIDAPDDVFWLERGEVTALLDGDTTDRRAEVVDRRARWDHQRRLVPPRALGDPGHATEALEQFADHSRVDGGLDEDRAVVRGVPASPGRAQGPVCVVRGPDEFDRVRDGDVLVAPLTAPAWTPLFARVAAVVTDGGSLAAHASLIAREYAIPAVVATHDATNRLTTGTIVTVDGGRGTVELS